MKIFIKYWVFLSYLIISLLCFSCACQKQVITNERSDQPRNVILLISDGTGLSQISSTFFHKESTPNYARFKNIGFIKTSSSIQDITDSAAAATALATGEKTYNGAIGVAIDSTKLLSITEILHEKDVKTGIIATSSITHATPASFFAHVFHRSMHEDIALDLSNANIDFFAGGGLKYFNLRSDSINLLKTNKLKKYYLNLNKLEDFTKIKDFDKVGFLLAQNDMPRFNEGRGDFLPEATDLAIRFLSKENASFFLMSEGSQIDWGGHQNDGAYLISEIIDFDNAIGRALDFAENDGNTLVIVTSDHETGGFTLSASKGKKPDGTEFDDYRKVGYSFSNKGHSATLIPVFAYGPGSETFQGIYENADIFHKIIEVANWKNN